MAFLTRRKSGTRFQIRVPRALEATFGTTPIRINLGLIPARDARRWAIALAEEALRGFERNMSRAAIEKRLAELTDEIQNLRKRKKTADFRSLGLQEGIDTYRTFTVQEQGYTEHDEKLLLTLGTSSQIYASIIQRLEQIQDGLNNDLLAVDGEEGARTLAIVEDLKAQFAVFSGQMQQVASPNPKSPVLSSVIPEWLKVKSDQGIAEKNVKEQGARIKDFIDFAGDRPIEDYGFLDFQKFVNLLARVPSNWNKLPAFRSGSLSQAADRNDQLPANRRHSTLAQKTIEAKYLSPLRNLFRAQCAHFKVPNPLSDAKVHTPVTATESIERSSFTVEDLNVWFATAARESRPDMKWLPILATLTGARIGELIYLQGKDIFELEPGLWVADLTTALINSLGEEEKRKLKNKASRRLFALHSALGEIGFIRYAAERKKEAWVFPHAHGLGKKLVKDPSDAASKRLNRQLRRVGVHKTLEITFHSSRHSAKDIFRDGGLDQRLHDQQTGHAPRSASDNYGSKRLRALDAKLIAALPLPEGLDLSPYLRR